MHFLDSFSFFLAYLFYSCFSAFLFACLFFLKEKEKGFLELEGWRLRQEMEGDEGAEPMIRLYWLKIHLLSFFFFQKRAPVRKSQATSRTMKCTLTWLLGAQSSQFHHWSEKHFAGRWVKGGSFVLKSGSQGNSGSYDVRALAWNSVKTKPKKGMAFVWAYELPISDVLVTFPKATQWRTPNGVLL